MKKSRFIAIAKPCKDISQVKGIVEGVRLEHPGANHVVHAAVVGNQFSFSDDKEPRNTAGRPAFEVLKGSGISDICVLVVRYFGGTLLGTGGLVKAYGDSVRAVLLSAQTEEFVQRSSFSLAIPYSLYDSVKRLFSSLEATVEKEMFESNVRIEGIIPSKSFGTLQDALSDLSNGGISAILTNG